MLVAQIIYATDWAAEASLTVTKGNLVMIKMHHSEWKVQAYIQGSSKI